MRAGNPSPLLHRLSPPPRLLARGDKQREEENQQALDELIHGRPPSSADFLRTFPETVAALLEQTRLQ